MAVFDPSTDLDQNVQTIPPAYAQTLDAIAPNVVTITTQQVTPAENWYDTLSRILPVITTNTQQSAAIASVIAAAQAGAPAPTPQSLGFQSTTTVQVSTPMLIIGALLAYAILRR